MITVVKVDEAMTLVKSVIIHITSIFIRYAFDTLQKCDSFGEGFRWPVVQVKMHRSSTNYLFIML